MCPALNEEAREPQEAGATLQTSLFLNVPKFNVKTNHVHVAVYIPQEQPKKNYAT